MTLVFGAYIGLLALVAATPVLLFFDNLVVGSAVEYCAAIGMTIIAIGMRPGEARHFFKVIRVPAVLAAIPLLWMLVQMLPIPIAGLSRSIWESAASALGVSLWANISIDPALTLIALCRFASIVGIGFVAAAVSIERGQAEKVLWVLAAAAVVISLAHLAGRVGVFQLPIGTTNEAAFASAGVVGFVLFAASAVMVVERYEIRGNRHHWTAQLVIPVGITVVGLLVCLVSMLVGAAGSAIFAAACGVATIAIIYFVRRIGFGPRAGLAMGAVAIFALAAIIVAKGDPAAGDITLRYMSAAKADIVARDTRVIDEVGLGGSGAGTSGVLGTLYGIQGPPDDLGASTFAALVAIELGRPALWLMVGLAGAIVIICARGAFNRGRDFFYPLAGTGVGVAMVLDSFSSAGLANLAVAILVVVTLGLSFAQSIGRSL